MTERKKYKILVAEDNPINIKVSAFVLKPIADVIDIAQNGAEVLEKFKNNTYDVILMDVKMPIMDGYEATIKIRKMEADNKVEKPIVIIATTANSQPEEVDKCKNIGMNDLMVKPFSINDILAIIEH
ncbi:MAG: response regulator [Prolixibacteraceae bacterium]|jgi:CheY-like chemotaxis protein|nr:response regulator [Prolixibacteraceae bacterium]